jgi:outer membrane protein assembly factor BamB/plastocyanin
VGSVIIRSALLAAVAGLTLAAPAGATDVAGCAPPAGGGDWPFYGATYDNHREQLGETTITPANAGTLGVAWKTAMPDGGAIQSVPTVVDGCVFTGTDLGEAYAFNADTGQKVWETKLQGGGGNFAVGAGVIGAPAVADGLVYVAATKDGSSMLFALDEITGAIVWSHVVDSDSGGGADSSPIPFDGMIFQAYQGDESSNHSNPGFAVIDGSREGGGRELVHTRVIPDANFAAGDRGGSIVDTPAYDPASKMMYVGTGNPASPHANARTDSLLKIDVDPTSATFGQILASAQGARDSYPAPTDVDSPVCQTDVQWPVGRFTCAQFDFNFLASPALWNQSDGHEMFGGLQKAGVFTAVDATTMQKAWTATLGAPCFACNLSSIAIDAKAIYVAVTGGNLYALDRDTGSIKWVVPGTGATHYEGLTVANGVLFTNNDLGALEAFNTADGTPLLAHPFAQDTNTPMSDSGNSSGISVARDTVFVSSKDNSTSTLFAFKLGAGGGGGGGGPGLPALPGAPGAGGQVISGPGAANYGYLTPVATTTVGGALSYTNEDVSRHDVVADDKGADGQPLFHSELAALNETVPVTGTDRLQSGQQYTFHCSIHPGMHGTLIVQ